MATRSSSSSTSGATRRWCEPELIAGLRAGDNEAFSTLYDRYAKSLVHVATRESENEAIAEDVVQEAFFRMWLNRERLREDGSPLGYLYRTVRRRVWNYHRHCKVEEYSALMARNGEAEPICEPYLDIERDIDGLKIREEVLAVVDTLPRQMAATYRLLRLESLTYPEAAARMGLSIKTVEMHMTRALKVLRVQLSHLPI